MGNMITNWWWGGPPDEPHELSGLSLRDIHSIQQSWKPVYADACDNGIEIFLRLFHEEPETKAFFKAIRGLDDGQIKLSAQFRAHAINLMSAFNMALMNLHQPEVVTAMMHKLGDAHKRHGINKRHFETMRIVFVHFLKTDRKATPALIQSWARFINFIYSSILERQLTQNRQ